MAETENKNKHTLYRFVSLRNPELSDKKDQNQRFVFHFDNKSGVFFREMIGKNENESKWQNLQNTSQTFPAFKTEVDIEAKISEELIAVSTWLSRNRTKLNPKIVLEKISKLKVLDLKVEIDIWDNLFYQVVTQKDFYIKEILMQLLVLNNLLKFVNSGITNDDKIISIPILAKARVVLPTFLFEDDNKTITHSARQSEQDSEASVEELKENNKDNANQNINELELAKNEIEKLQKKYNKDVAKAYQVALSEHEAATKPLIDKYNKEWNEAKRKLCDIPRPDNYNPDDYCNQPNVNYPELPIFDFNFPQRTDVESLREILAADTFATLQKYNTEKDIDSLSEIIENINEAISLEQRKLVENTNFSSQVLLINGIVISAQSRKSKLSRKSETLINPAFVPERFGVRNIGIADYKKVISQVCCYDAGEVSHIENIMAKELRSKTTTRERVEEFTQIDETSQEKESLTDTTSTDRFEMQTEVSKILAEQRQASAGVNFHAGWGAGDNNYTLDAGANYATNSSKEESNRQAVTQAKDITNRAMERIVTKVRRETIKKTTERFKEENIHAFDNTLGENHVSGVYRFINAIYKNEVFNYGKRMMYEFMIPQPSKLHQIGMIESKNTSNIVKLAMPLDPRENGLATAVALNSANANFWASKFGIEIKQLPNPTIKISKTFSGGTDLNKNTSTGNLSGSATKENIDLQIPEGYQTIHAKISCHRTIDDRNQNYNSFGFSVGNIQRFNPPSPYIIDTESNILANGFVLENYVKSISIGYQSLANVGFNLSVSLKCALSPDGLLQWQNETFNAIINAYETKLADYQSSLSDNLASRESNPGFYRQIEQLVLRKNCISYLMEETKMGQGFYEFTDPSKKDLANFHIIQDQTMDNYASLAKFMEQAFEWNNISYNFYPFYWGKREDWDELYQFDCNDPLFRNFMQAGMARVVVTVKPGFENAVLHFMATNQIWNGGEIPVLGNPLYLSIVDEIKEQEYTVEETWETVVPTSLIGLQKSGVSIDEEGLPCDIDCTDDAGKSFKVNDNTLGKKILDVIAIKK